MCMGTRSTQFRLLFSIRKLLQSLFISGLCVWKRTLRFPWWPCESFANAWKKPLDALRFLMDTVVLGIGKKHG